MNKEIRRGDLYYAELDPVVGSEQAGTRPVLVVSNDIGNQYSPVIVIVPITSRRIGKKQLPTHVEVRMPELLKNDSTALTEQIRTIDKLRLKEYIGSLPDCLMAAVDQALAISIGIGRQIVIHS
ncbi:MAG: type II toxin-antitoxin system PemK/MazF family toxin [Clostridia bacterium]|nr:type II toxin-antitoxin system PemK/MazF family toxin [Clostridia bacterium]